MNNDDYSNLFERNFNDNRPARRGITWITIAVFAVLMIAMALSAAAVVIALRRNENGDDRPLYVLPPTPATYPATAPEIPDSDFFVESGAIGTIPNPLDEFEKYHHPDWVGFIEHPFQPQNYPVTTMHVLRRRSTSNQVIGIIFQDDAEPTKKYGLDLTLKFMREIYRATRDKLNTFHRLTSGPCLVYYLRDSKSLGEAEMNYSPRSSWLGTKFEPGMQTHLHEFGHNIFHFVARDTGRNRGSNGDDDMKDWVESIRLNKDVWRENRIYDWCFKEFFYECEETRPGEHFAGAVSGFFCRRQRDLMRTYDPLNYNILTKYFYERDITEMCPK